ncbi:MAG: hypothetical protein DI585_05450 [Pseudomonas fluorescens]|nr:MAG: hypothetical protein DI585_05450 [Pseudomonas fluorescens]
MTTTAAHITHTLNAPINGLAWIDNTCAAITGDGLLHLARIGMEKSTAIEVSSAPLLAILNTPDGFVTSDEDGNIHLTTLQGETTLLTATKYMFLESIAYYAKKRQVLAATGKTITVINPDGTSFVLPHKMPSTIGGLAVSPIGPRVAASHYGGSTILALDNINNPPRLLPWKGSHLGLTYTPDGKWLISSMQEQALHLWRLADGLDLQMRGYPSKITQFSWDHSGTLLATNGGGGVPLWNFSGPKGPAGTQARVLADSGAQEVLVTTMAMHPKGPFCAIGYTDGLTLLTQIVEDRAVLLHQPNEHATTHAAWSPDGMSLATANANGTLLLTDFAALV